MTAKKNVRRTKSVASVQQPVSALVDHCDVARLGVQIGELWAAKSAAEDKLSETTDAVYRPVATQITSDLFDWIEKAVDLASHQRAASLAGALVHVALICDGVIDITSNRHSDDEKEECRRRLVRMLHSVTIVLRKAMGEASFAPLAEVTDVYLGTELQDENGGALSWIDLIPKLVAEERARGKQVRAEKLAGRKEVSYAR